MRYPNITVKLVGEDGNAFSIISKIKYALRKNKISEEEQSEFMKESMSGDYDHVLQTAMNWVNVE